MRAMFKNFTPQHWGWLHFKVALGIVWPLVFLMFTPGVAGPAVGFALTLTWVLITIAGAIIGIVGLILSVQASALQRTIGISIELVGLILLAVGPLAYLLTQLGLVVSTGGIDRIALVFFAYAMLAAVVCRILVVFPRFREEARDSSKGV